MMMNNFEDLHGIKDIKQFEKIIDDKVANINTLKDLGISPTSFKDEAKAIIAKQVNDISAKNMD